MRIKSCKRCGRNFTATSKYTYLCSECHTAVKASGAVADRTCRQCGAIFPGGPRAWYCPDCRLERKREADRRAKRYGSKRPLNSIDLCERCGGEYTVNSGRQRYCPACAADATKENIKQGKQDYYLEHKERYAQHKAQMRSNRHVCIICGKVFDSDRAVVTCSDACDKIKRRQQSQHAEAKRQPRKRSNKDGENQ